ncbi:hypothetical protein DEMA109039_08310 [Deinococcus marmoris]
MNKAWFGILSLVIASAPAVAQQAAQPAEQQVMRCTMPENGSFTCWERPLPQPGWPRFRPVPIWPQPIPDPAPQPVTPTPVPISRWFKPMPIRGPIFCLDYIAPGSCPGMPRPILDVR